jgi:hypothetical protein
MISSMNQLRRLAKPIGTGVIQTYDERELLLLNGDRQPRRKLLKI